MQCKDIQDLPILRLLATKPDVEFGWHDLKPRWCYRPSVREAFPTGIPDRLLLAKMGMLIRRGLIDGCTCGCGGDFRITEKGAAYLTSLGYPVRAREPFKIPEQSIAPKLPSDRAISSRFPENSLIAHTFRMNALIRRDETAVLFLGDSILEMGLVVDALNYAGNKTEIATSIETLASSEDRS